MAWAVSRWQCSASAVMTASVMSIVSRSVRSMGISLVLAPMASWASTVPVAWHNPLSRCTRFPAASRAPRSVLPSKAITRRPAIMVVRSHIHAPISWSNSFGASRCRQRRMVDSDGIGPVTPSRASTPGAASAAHSAIATNERAPASVAASATASTPGSAWRFPRGLRGSGTFAISSSKPSGAAGTSANSPSSGSDSSTRDKVGDDGAAGTAGLPGR
jgi:hypothetical protein